MYQGGEFKDLVFLTQTDTTIGLLSQNEERLTQIKQRPPHKHYIRAVASLHELQKYSRVPNQYKNRVRRASKTTFVFPNGRSIRVIKEPNHQRFVEKFKWLYTTSANLSGQDIDYDFASQHADVIVKYPLQNTPQTASTIFKLGSRKIKRLR